MDTPSCNRMFCKFPFVSRMKILRTLACFVARWNYGVRLRAGVLATSCTCSASVSSLQPPASEPCYTLVFLGSQMQLQLWASMSSLQSTSLFSQLQTYKQHTFLLPFRNCSNVLLSEKPYLDVLPKQEQLCRPLCQCHGYLKGTILSLKLCFGCLDKPSWARLKMIAMTIKGQLYLKDYTIFSMKDHTACNLNNLMEVRSARKWPL